MRTKRIRWILILAGGLILTGILAFLTLPAGKVMAEPNTLVGSWTVTVTPPDQPTFIDQTIFSSDGTVTIMENDGRSGLGVWEKLTGDQYAFTVWEYFQQDGATLQAKLRSTITLSQDKEMYTGPFHLQVSVLGGPVVLEGYGTASGVRNHVEPMP